MENKKYAFLEVGGEDCPIRSWYENRGQFICKKDNYPCSEARYMNCSHGKTIEEMAEHIEWEEIAYRSQAKEVIEALLGGEDK